MRLSLTKLLTLAIWVPSLVLISISGYFLYNSYHQYTVTEKSVKYLKLAKKIEKILIYIGQERGASSIYSVSKGQFPDSKKLMDQKRALVNNAVMQLKDYVRQNPMFYKDTRNIINQLNRLPEIRRKIDNFQDNYIKNEFVYYTNLSKELIKTEANILDKFPADLKPLYIVKMQYEKMIDYTGIIRGFGAYYITADAPITQKEYENILLRYYHDSNILLTELLKNKIAASTYQGSEFNKVEEAVKAVMFYFQQANQEYYLTGKFNGYPIDSYDYYHLFTKRISFYNNTINHLNEKISQELQKTLSKLIKTRNINIVIFLIAIFILIIGYYLHKSILKHVKSLSDLVNSLAPITGKKLNVDITTPQGMDDALKTVDEAIKITQESIKKAEEAAKAKALFLANMSHEIRTPLNGILGFLELLNTTELTKEQLDYVNTISQSAKNLLQIVNNILDVSKIESEKVTLELIDFKAVDEFENTLEIFSTPAAQKNIQYVAEISPNIPTTLKGDILKIKEILTNLINNAIKFTPQNGLISVKINLEKLENNKASIYFEVKDTGIGMSEEQKNKIFEAFTQADESVTRKYGGTGLGLTIVKSYLEMMGSSIQVESAVNQGSKFFFTIDFEVIDEKPRYKEDSFHNITLAILNTMKDSLRKEFSIEYFNYFGASRIGFNNLEELKKIETSENINGIVVFYEESNKETIEELTQTDVPLIFISSHAHKEEIDKLNPDATVYDPNVPTKTYNILITLKEQKIHHHKKKVVREAEVTPIYKLKALIAEDNPINMKFLKTMLKSLGIEADTADNGLEAFNKYTINPDKYDVIFMDVQMPVMDGVEATHEILEFEKEEEIPHTPIIAVTANALKGDREKFIGAGMDDYISKPIKKEELLKILENVANHKYTEETGEETKTTTVSEHEEDTIKPEPIKEEPKEKTTEETERPQEVKPQTTQTPVSKEKEEKIIIATDSSFLANYLHAVLDFDFESVSKIKDLNKKLSKEGNYILLIEENFNGADTEALIKSIREEAPNIKIIVIGEEKIAGADDIISDMNPENITETINKIKGNK